MMEIQPVGPKCRRCRVRAQFIGWHCTILAFGRGSIRSEWWECLSCGKAFYINPEHLPRLPGEEDDSDLHDMQLPSPDQPRLLPESEGQSYLIENQIHCLNAAIYTLMRDLPFLAAATACYNPSAPRPYQIVMGNVNTYTYAIYSDALASLLAAVRLGYLSDACSGTEFNRAYFVLLQDGVFDL